MMLSKRDKMIRAAEGLAALRCPACGGEMTRRGDAFACGRGHSVNMNRKEIGRAHV